MKSINNRLILAAALLAAAVASGCPTSPVANGPTSNNAAPQPPNTTRTPENVNKTEPVNAGNGNSTGSLATPTDAYKTAFAIRRRKDAQAMKRVLSKEILEFFAEMGKVEGKSLDEMLKELVERPQAGEPEVRNEKITGNRAILEFKDDKGGWSEMDFVKEDGEWKLTLPKAESPKK